MKRQRGFIRKMLSCHFPFLLSSFPDFLLKNLSKNDPIIRARNDQDLGRFCKIHGMAFPYITWRVVPVKWRATIFA